MPKEEAARLRPARAEATLSTHALNSGTHSALPADLVEKAARRLGWVGAVYAVSYFIVYNLSTYAYRYQPEVARHLDFYTNSMMAGVALGLGIFVLSLSGKVAPRTMLDVGLLFEVAGALLIGIAETVMPFTPDYNIRGHSAIVVWVVFFVLVVPASTGKAAIASFSAACMGPLGLLINVAVHGVPVPSESQLMLLFAAPFLMAFYAVLLSRYVYSLGKQVGKASEMGSYELVELIGRGGMGEVWRARHRMLARSAAIKLIRPEALQLDSKEKMASARRRFEREARATARLTSPHTVALYDYGVSESGNFYYVMEMLDGLDLDTLVLRFGPLPAPRVAFLMCQMCESLAEAHAAGLIHRDIKPKNIFACRQGLLYDFVKVLDFGLVKVSGSSIDTRLTREGLTTGTPAFMSPEMSMGHHEVDARTDVYALGCVGYWLLTGQLVFEASTPLAMALEHVKTIPVPPSQRTEIEVPEDIERILMSCLEKDPRARPQSARELGRALASCASDDSWNFIDAESWWRMHLPDHEIHPIHDTPVNN
ncbi:MAG: serine/threonine protein kinase [Acidobacteriia bacterium]|nr:serine/threonine protein kinase [Terriglobia bacterium]